MSDDRRYLHGYNETERQRLMSQSLFLEPWIYERVDYTGRQHLLEVGCGVGAQLKFPALRIVARWCQRGIAHQLTQCPLRLTGHGSNRAARLPCGTDGICRRGASRQDRRDRTVGSGDDEFSTGRMHSAR